MKKNYFLILVTLVFSSEIKAQLTTIDFDTNSSGISIDTSLPNNIWQIRVPQKTFFTAVFSPTKAMVTDTQNVYPPSNFSQFTFLFIITGGPNPTVSFKHKMNTRANTDGGYVELSADSGLTWHLLSDSSNINWYLRPPVNLFMPSNTTNFYALNSIKKDTLFNGHLGFSGTYDWIESSIYFRCMAFKTDFDFLMRFTFVSDTGQTTNDGWMIDDIKISNGTSTCSGIKETRRDLVSLYPNPASDRLNINLQGFENLEGLEISFYNLLGQKTQQQKITQTETSLAVKDWQRGVYLYRLEQEGRFVKSGRVMID